MKKEMLVVEGMTCGSCANKIKESVSTIEGVEVIDLNVETGLVEVTFDETKTTLEEVKTSVRESGYPVIEKETKSSGNSCSCCSVD